MFMGEGVALAEADARAAGERCPVHRGNDQGSTEAAATQANRRTGTLIITVRRWEPRGLNIGEYVGAPRTLAGPFRMGFDGTREQVLWKYRDWLHGQVASGGPVAEKLRSLLPQARCGAGLVLTCVVPEIGEVIAGVLRWMDSTEGNKGNEVRKDSAA